MRRSVLTTLVAVALDMALLSAPVWAADNAALWQGMALPPLPAVDGLLARGDSMHVLVGLEPSFDWRRLDGNSSLHATGALSFHAQSLVEAARYGYILRAADLALQLSSLQDETADGSRATSRVARLLWRCIEAEGRFYPDVAVLAPIDPSATPFLVATLGSYGGELGREEQEGAQTSTMVGPLSLAAGVGVGRLLPIGARLVLAQIETILAEDGVIDAPLPEAARADILRTWIAQRDELGYASRVTLLLKIVADAGLARRPLAPATAYRLEAMMRALVFGTALERWHGWDLRLLGRLGRTFAARDAAAVATPWATTLELRARWVWNMSLTTDLSINPAFGWSPRRVDSFANILVGVDQPNALDVALPRAALPGERARLTIPVRYLQQFLDTYYNSAGVLSAGGSVSVARSDTNDFSLDAGCAYTFFFSGVQGIKLGVIAGAARIAGEAQTQLGLVAAYVDGTGSTYYVAPDNVGGETPPLLGPWVN